MQVMCYPKTLPTKKFDLQRDASYGSMPCLSFKLPRNPLHQHLALELRALFGAHGILVGGGILPVEDAFQVPKEVGNGIAE